MLGSGREQVPATDVRADSAEVPPRELDGAGIDLRGVQLHVRNARRQGGTDRSASAAQVDRHQGRRGALDGAIHEEFGAPPRDENSRPDLESQSVEIHPAEDVFQRFARDPAADQHAQFLPLTIGIVVLAPSALAVGPRAAAAWALLSGRRVRRVEQQPRLVLGEHASGCPKRIDDVARDGRRDRRARPACRHATARYAGPVRSFLTRAAPASALPDRGAAARPG